jgi:hypothetical protein
MGNSTPERFDTVKKNIEFLLEMQKEDGSWKSPEMLQFPLPSNIGPWTDPRRVREDLYDQKGIFTTAACLMGLSNISKYYNN